MASPPPQNTKDFLLTNDYFQNDENNDSPQKKIQDNYEENYISKNDDANSNSKFSLPSEEEKDITSSPKTKLDFKKKMANQLALQIPPKKGRSVSATLKNYALVKKKQSDEALVITEEDDNNSYGEENLVKKERKANSETDIKRMKKNGRYLNLKLEISKNLKKKENLACNDMVGIKKEKKYYYFREKIVDDNEIFFIKGIKRSVNCIDDQKVKNFKICAADLNVLKIYKDDLDFLQIKVKFLQNP